MDEKEEILTPREARQGPRGRPVLYVLIGSLILGALYILSMLLWGQATDRQQPPPRQGWAIEETIG